MIICRLSKHIDVPVRLELLPILVEPVAVLVPPGLPLDVVVERQMPLAEVPALLIVPAHFFPQIINLNLHVRIFQCWTLRRKKKC